MQVQEIREQAKTLQGRSITAEGYLSVVRRGYHRDILLDDDDPRHDALHIAHSFAFLRQMIAPLPTLQLIHRGDAIYPPYLYRFPVVLSATVVTDDTGRITLQRVTHLSTSIPIAGRFAENVPDTQYRYVAHITYDTPTDHTRIDSEKHIRLRHVDADAPQPTYLYPQENRYARNVLQTRLILPGRLHYVAGQFILRTQAVRASVVGVGFLRNQTHIWWRPHAHHALVRAHSTLSNAAEAGQQVAITGEMAYLYADDEQIPRSLPYPPQLVFNQVDAISIYDRRDLPADDAP